MSRRTVFGSLLGLVFVINLSRVVFAPLIEPIRAATGASDATLGLLATLVWLGSALTRLPTGYLLTRISRAKAIFGSGIVLTVGTTYTALSSDPTWLLVGGFSMGLASGIYLIAANTLISELYPEYPGRALGQHGVAGQLAAVVAPALVTGALLLGTWRTTLQLIAVGAALTTILFTVIARRTELPDAGAEDRALLAAIKAQWRIIGTGIATLGLTSMVWNGLFNFYVTYLGTLSIPDSDGRLLLLVAFGAGVPAFYVSGRLADRLPNLQYMLALIAAFAVCILVLPVVTGFWPLVAYSVIIGYVIHSLFPAADTYLLGSLPDHHRASAYAAYGGGMMLIQAPGSAVVGALRDGGFAFGAIFTVMGLGLLLVLGILLGLYSIGQLPTTAKAEP